MSEPKIIWVVGLSHVTWVIRHKIGMESLRGYK